MAASTKFTLHSRREYLLDLAATVTDAAAGERIVVTTMTFDPTEPLVAQLLEQLCAAAERGVHVYFAVDAFSFLSSGKKLTVSSVWLTGRLSGTMPEPYRSRLHSLRQLKHAGVHTAITNLPARPFSLIPAGRSHIKAAVVGDKVYIGGCNLRDAREIDIMMSFHDAKAAEWLFGQLQILVTTQSTRTAFKGTDQSFKLDSKTTIYIDAGVPRQSLIYTHALHLIDTAREDLTITCQYFPGGPTGTHLRAALNRGVVVHVLYSHPSVHGLVGGTGHHIHQLLERTRLPAELFNAQVPRSLPKLHAKIIATEQGAIIGSHNYVMPGVRFGTAEIALLRRDPVLSVDLTAKIQQEIFQHPIS